jgi:hypothetical protein
MFNDKYDSAILQGDASGVWFTHLTKNLVLFQLKLVILEDLLLIRL